MAPTRPQCSTCGALTGAPGRQVTSVAGLPFGCRALYALVGDRRGQGMPRRADAPRVQVEGQFRRRQLFEEREHETTV
jgi:hypothetical protein